jgi:hypothetical protein
MNSGFLSAIRLVLVGILVFGLGEARCEEAGVRRQPVSKWIVDLKAPLKNAYEETNERGQVLQLGEREISFRLTQPANSVVVQVLFSTYAVSPAASPTYLRYAMTEEYPYPADWNEVKCTDTMGIPVGKMRFLDVAAEDTVVAVWDYTWDEKLIEGFQVAPWGMEAYGGGLTKADYGKFVIVETAVPSKGRELSCNQWLPDPYHPDEIWGTWRHDERGRVVQGRYVIRAIAYSNGETESHVFMQPSLALVATENGADLLAVVRGAVMYGEEPFWGWYTIPTAHASTRISAFQSLREQLGDSALIEQHPWLAPGWDGGQEK